MHLTVFIKDGIILDYFIDHVTSKPFFHAKWQRGKYHSIKFIDENQNGIWPGAIDDWKVYEKQRDPEVIKNLYSNKYRDYDAGPSFITIPHPSYNAQGIDTSDNN